MKISLPVVRLVVAEGFGVLGAERTAGFRRLNRFTLTDSPELRTGTETEG